MKLKSCHPGYLPNEQKKVNNRYIYRYLGLSLISILLMIFCETYETNPVSSENLVLPAAPSIVTVKIGNGVVFLSWELVDSVQVEEFRIYRRGDEDAFQQIGSTKSTSFRDEFLTNGIQYYYQVAAVSVAGYEGEHSKVVSVTPSIYSIILAGGAKITNSRNVLINITAPTSTSLMMFSNDSTFSDSNWEPLATTRSWELTFGDGLKKVFAKFRNSDDQETEKAVTAEITLDTRAVIAYLEEDSQGKVLESGDVLHIRLKAEEINGYATAEINDPAFTSPARNVKNILLYDDGTHGDAVADDGIYEIDYFIGHGIEVEDAFLYGYFTDLAGNTAEMVTAENRLTINPLPEAPVLFEPTIIQGNSSSLLLRWTSNSNDDFSVYQIMRSNNYVVSLSSDFVAEISTQNTTTYLDTTLSPATDYYYRVYVFDTYGNSTGSNIVDATTSDNEPPKPVVLSQPVQDSLSLVITWSPSSATDFANYRVFRSSTSPVDTSFAPIRIIKDANITEFRDTSVVANLNYFYKVYVYDIFGLSAGSNEVQGRLLP